MHREPGIDKLLWLARELRQRQTPAEQILWELLRDRKLLGLKFRRQHRIGTFIVDFFCAATRLVIEVDGGIHATREQVARDENRDSHLEDLGYQVLRLSNREILDDPGAALLSIARANGHWLPRE